MDDDSKTHFGFKQVSFAEKAEKVAGVFHSVAGKYDVMNDLMSLGTHRIMKQMAVDATRARAGHKILDLAGGTGDLTSRLARLVGASGLVCLTDINGSMLNRGRDRLINQGLVGNVTYVQADAEALPFPDSSFNAITIAFGLRNVTRKEKALAAMFRTLLPGGRLVILEFSRPEHALVQRAYEGFNKLWPQVGKLVTGDSDSYQYLVESIKMHPDQETLKSMMEDAGFTRVKYQNLLDGVAAIHEGIRPRS